MTTEIVVSAVGTYVPDDGLELHIGQIQSETPYLFRMSGYYKDVRLYDRRLSTAEAIGLYANQNDYDHLTNGLVFHGLAVRTSELASYVDELLEENMKIRDNIYGLVGTVHYNPAAGAGVYGADPEI